MWVFIKDQFIVQILKEKQYNAEVIKEPSLENTSLYNVYARR